MGNKSNEKVAEMSRRNFLKTSAVLSAAVINFVPDLYKSVASEIINLGAPVAIDSAGYGISVSGKVCGYVKAGGGSEVAFLWDSITGMTDLGTLGGDQSYAMAINEIANQVVGYSTTAEDKMHAFLWDDGVIEDLGTLEGGQESEAYCINDSGQVVGWSETAEEVLTVQTEGANGEVSATTANWLEITGSSTNVDGIVLQVDFRAEGVSETPVHVTLTGANGGTDYSIQEVVDAINIITQNLGDDGSGNNLNYSMASVELDTTALNYVLKLSSRTTDADSVTVRSDSINGVMVSGAWIDADGDIANMLSDGSGDFTSTGERGSGEMRVRGFLWESDSMEDLGTLGGDESMAYDINNSGQIVGCAETDGDKMHAFLWDSDTITDLGSFDGDESCAVAINDSEEVVGWSSHVVGSEPGGLSVQTRGADGEANATTADWLMITGSSTNTDGIVFQVDFSAGGGSETPVHVTLTGSNAGTGYSIQDVVDAINIVSQNLPNDSNGNNLNYSMASVELDTTATSYVLKLSSRTAEADDVTVRSDSIGGATITNAWMDADGDVADMLSTGSSDFSSTGTLGVIPLLEVHGCLWADDAMADLGTLGGDESKAHDINSSGEIVGYSLTDVGDKHACLWVDDDITDLNDLLGGGSPWELVEAFAINDDGHITGVGLIGGQTHAFLLLPDGEVSAGDLDGNGQVNVVDLGIMAGQWGSPGGVPDADIAPVGGGDGTVNMKDFRRLAKDWMKW